MSPAYCTFGLQTELLEPNREMSSSTERTRDQLVIVRRERCAVCAGALVPAIDLPALPITDSYCREPIADPIPGIDQRLLYCEACGHGQLESLLAPSALYGTNYFFRTSASETARKGTDFFLSVLDEVSLGRRFQCVLDLGCNDLHLLARLVDRADHRVGVDPVWSGREGECEDESVLVFGAKFEELDVTSLPAKPDLIVCRHTLEHIVEPEAVVRRLLDICDNQALYVFEVPGFDGLLQRLRFDQVFHQHCHYFSLASFLELLEVVGAKYVFHRFNYHDWGSMAIAFSRNGNSASKSRPTGTTWLTSDIRERYGLFHRQMQNSFEALTLYRDGPVYGYGAAQMLPVLGYHMGTDFSELNAVLDDDPAKAGIGYWNLPVRVVPSTCVTDFAAATVLITAIDSVQPIMARLLARRPRHILHPLNVI